MSLDVTLYFDVDVGHEQPERHVVYEANITHNLGAMAEQAGMYKAMWRPDENGFETAGQVGEAIREGLAQLHSGRAKFAPFDAKNGWGTYEDLVSFTEEYLLACLKYPKAKVSVSR